MTRSFGFGANAAELSGPNSNQGNVGATDIPNQSGQVLFRADGISKSFGGAAALRSADFSVGYGEVHGLMGANGAGKSTLSKIISGRLHADSGALHYRGQPLTDHSVRKALDLGIAMVMQETSLAPDLSVLENIFLPEMGRGGRIRWAASRRRAQSILDELGGHHDLKLETPISQLSSAGRQMVEIAKALALDAELIIFDEPTAALSTSEVDALFQIMARLRDNGKGLVFVSHRLEEVLDITDRVSVLREGQNTANGLLTSDLDQAEIIRLMVGQRLNPLGRGGEGAKPQTKRDAILEVRELSAPPMVQNVSFSLGKGEILGIAGLVGAGRTEMAEAIFGLRPHSGGQVVLDNRPYVPHGPRKAIAAGICLAPEDRRYQSIVPDLTVKENLLLAHIGRGGGIGLASRETEEELDRIIETLDLPKGRMNQSLLGFSGGMQQKVILARWLLMRPKVLILDEPTKGVDIQTRQSIYALLAKVAKTGVGILVISSDFEELIHVSDRIVVMSDGSTIAELPGGVVDEAGLTLLSAPRSSSEQNARILARFAQQFGGEAFWMLRASDQALCLHATATSVETVLGAGQGRLVPQVNLPFSFHKSGEWQRPAGSDKAIFVAERLNARGHGLGHFGLILSGTDLPEPQQVLTFLEEGDSDDSGQ